MMNEQMMEQATETTEEIETMDYEKTGKLGLIGALAAGFVVGYGTSKLAGKYVTPAVKKLWGKVFGKKEEPKSDEIPNIPE